MPKALRDFLGMSFFFWSNEGGDRLEPVHIHVCYGTPSSNATKFWLKQNGQITLEHNRSNLSDGDLARAMDYIKGNYNAIIAEWYRHFGM